MLIDTTTSTTDSQTSNTSITVKLSDDTGAYTLYKLNVTFVSSKPVRLQRFDKISVNVNSPVVYRLDSMLTNCKVYTCNTRQLVDWT